MKILSFKQKLGVLSVLVALIGAAAFMSTQSNSGLRSDVFNNPAFVCSDDTLTSQKTSYDQNVATIQNKKKERWETQKLVSELSGRLEEENAGIKVLEKEKNQIQNAIKGQQSALNGCRDMKSNACQEVQKNLTKNQQVLKNLNTRIDRNREQIKNISENLNNKTTLLWSIDSTIASAQSSVADYEACQNTLRIAPAGNPTGTTPPNKYRFASWVCQNGEKGKNSNFNTCQTREFWEAYVNTVCNNKVTSFASSQECGQHCGNGIRENTEQCDDGNTVTNDACSNTCQNNNTETPQLTLETTDSTDRNENIIILWGTTAEVFSTGIKSGTESATIGKVVFTYSAGTGTLAGRTAELWLGDTKITWTNQTSSITATKITFDNLTALIVPSTLSTLKLKLVSPAIGQGKTGTIVMNVDITKIEIMNAKGVTNSQAIPAISATINPANFSFVPALVTPTVITSLSPTTSIAKIKLTSNAGTNTSASASTAPVIALDTLTFSSTGSVGMAAADYILYLDGRPDLIVRGTQVGTNIVFNLSTFAQRSFTTDATYVISANANSGEIAALQLVKNGVQYDIDTTTAGQNIITNNGEISIGSQAPVVVTP
jgi:cysteine-rich repeat protein